MHEVTGATVLSRLLYAAPAWWASPKCKTKSESKDSLPDLTMS